LRYAEIFLSAAVASLALRRACSIRHIARTDFVWLELKADYTQFQEESGHSVRCGLVRQWKSEGQVESRDLFQVGSPLGARLRPTSSD